VASPTLSLFGQKYAANGAWPLRIFAISLIPWTFMSINQAALRADARHRDLALVSLLFAVMTLAGPVALGLLLGLNGLAGGWTLGVFVTSASLAVLAVRHRREERGGRSPPPRGTPIAGPGSPA
jgi:O-antigen/teichoic acid export membrane protein